jgi:hypothetical protein
MGKFETSLLGKAEVKGVKARKEIKYIDDGDEIKVFEKEVYSTRPKGKYLWQKRLRERYL